MQAQHQVSWNLKIMQNKMLSRFALLLTSLIITGCATGTSGESSAELSDRTKGVVAASTTYDVGTRTMDAWFFIRKKSETDKDKFVRLSAQPPFSERPAFGLLSPIAHLAQELPGTPGHAGRVMAVSLEPGEYELYSWTLYIQIMGGYGYISPKTPPKPLPFVVNAGQITYLGNLHGKTLMGSNIFGLSVPGDGTAVISNDFEHDIPLLKAKFPMLLNWPINDAQLNGQAWK